MSESLPHLAWKENEELLKFFKGLILTPPPPNTHTTPPPIDFVSIPRPKKPNTFTFVNSTAQLIFTAYRQNSINQHFHQNSQNCFSQLIFTNIASQLLKHIAELCSEPSEPVKAFHRESVFGHKQYAYCAVWSSLIFT